MIPVTVHTFPVIHDRLTIFQIVLVLGAHLDPACISGVLLPDAVLIQVLFFDPLIPDHNSVFVQIVLVFTVLDPACQHCAVFSKEVTVSSNVTGAGLHKTVFVKVVSAAFNFHKGLCSIGSVVIVKAPLIPFHTPAGLVKHRDVRKDRGLRLRPGRSKGDCIGCLTHHIMGRQKGDLANRFRCFLRPMERISGADTVGCAAVSVLAPGVFRFLPVMVQGRNLQIFFDLHFSPVICKYCGAVLQSGFQAGGFLGDHRHGIHGFFLYMAAVPTADCPGCTGASVFCPGVLRLPVMAQGRNFHCRNALRLCPDRGKLYLLICKTGRFATRLTGDHFCCRCCFLLIMGRISAADAFCCAFSMILIPGVFHPPVMAQGRDLKLRLLYRLHGPIFLNIQATVYMLIMALHSSRFALCRYGLYVGIVCILHYKPELCSQVGSLTYLI